MTVETFGNDGFVITGDSIKTYRLMLLWQQKQLIVNWECVRFDELIR